MVSRLYRFGVVGFVAVYVAVLFSGVFLYERLLLPPDPVTSLVNTVFAASVSTAIVFPVSLFVSFYMVRRGMGGVLPFLTFSTAIPHTAVGLLLLPLISSLGIVDTAPAVIISMIVVSTPIGVGTLSSVFSSMGKSLDEYLQPLGIGELHIVLLHVRGALAGVFTAAILIWLRGFSELGALLIVANRPVTVGIYLFELFNRGGAALSVLYAVVVALIGLSFSVLLHLLSRKSTGV